MITILEINNSEEVKYSTAEGEKVSLLGYQIECYSGNTDTLQATESAMLIGKKVNSVLGSPPYKLTRVSTGAILPMIEDNSIIRYILRYECRIELETNTIYK
jgi:hypothetical protein